MRIKIDTINRIEADCRGDTITCLQKVIECWLKKDYDYESHGFPCWRRVCVAVKEGGGDTVLADEIALEHPLPTTTGGATPYPLPATTGGATPYPLPATTGGATPYPLPATIGGAAPYPLPVSSSASANLRISPSGSTGILIVKLGIVMTLYLYRRSNVTWKWKIK